jgi:hypothetical protein
MSDLTPEQQFKKMCDEIYKFCSDHNWGDPFNYSRVKEILMANELGHKVAPKLSGADAYEDSEMTIPVEYKSTVGKNIQATYNGISRQVNWDEQTKYLKEEKICKYKHHYFAKFDNGKIVELYKMTGDKVYEYLIPILKKQFFNENKRKDPRLGATIPKNFIINNSEKLL